MGTHHLNFTVFLFVKIKEAFFPTQKKPHNVAFNYSFMNKLGAV